MCRRMSASSGDAVSAMVSSSKMALLIFSSRKRLPWREWKRWSMALFSPALSLK